MNKKMYYLLRSLQIIGLIIICIIIIYKFYMLKNTANEIKYQQTEKFAYSLTNLAAAEVTRYLTQKKEKEIQLLVDDLSHDPLVRDATVYDNLGQILYQSENVLSLPELLRLNRENKLKIQGLVPHIAELYTENKKIGYIRITLEQKRILSLIHNYKDKSISTMKLLLILSFMAGTILMALFFRKLEAAYYYTTKELYLLTKKNSNYWRSLREIKNLNNKY